MRTRQLFRLHVHLASTLKLRFAFPLELITFLQSPLEAIEERPYIEKYLKRLLSSEGVRQHVRVRELLQISALTFDLRYGQSVMEGWCLVRVSPLKSLRGQQYVTSRCLGIRWTRTRVIRFILFLCAVLVLVAFIAGPVYRTDDVASVLVTSGTTSHKFLQAVIVITSAIIVLVTTFIVFQYSRRRTRWMVVKPTCIMFFKHPDEINPVDVLLFDQQCTALRSNFLQHGKLNQL